MKMKLVIQHVLSLISPAAMRWEQIIDMKFNLALCITEKSCNVRWLRNTEAFSSFTDSVEQICGKRNNPFIFTQLYRTYITRSTCSPIAVGIV